jgi:excinuclease ABC subunit A
MWFDRMLEAVADENGFSVEDPWEKLRKADQKIVLYGSGGQEGATRYRNRQGRQRSFVTHYEGVVPWLQRRHSESESDSCASGPRPTCARCPARRAAGPG